MATRLISFAKTLVGFLPGGLALINIVSAMMMGAIAGSAMASASAMGTILGPEMEKEGYSKEFGAAVNITSSTTGLVIPPSNTLIVYIDVCNALFGCYNYCVSANCNRIGQLCFIGYTIFHTLRSNNE